jgi:hypothetical protein
VTRDPLTIKPAIVSADLHGCGSSSLVLSDEHRQRVFEKRVVRKIFGPEMGKIIGC